MSSEQVASTLSPDGLRYVSRAGGSPFAGRSNGGDTRSCLLCGTHKLISNGRFKLLCGKQQFVCFTCKPEKPADPTVPVEAAA
jgi:hypothetical protein